MGDFKRGLGELKKNLEKEPLFKEKLKADVDKGEVFFAIRNNECSFYYKGQNLFKYSAKGFSTNSKFAFIPTVENYMTEKKLLETKATTFINGYKSTKARIRLYAEPESGRVSALYKFSPRKENINDQYFLVDLEVSLEEKTAKKDRPKKKKKTGTDEIDFLLYDNYNHILLFCEAKYYKNGDLSDKKNPPNVIRQLERYNKQINDDYVYRNILEQYKNAFIEYNYLFGTKLTKPKEICKKCGLYVFGFSQEKLKLFKNRLNNKTFYGHSCRMIGYTGKDSAEKIFRAFTSKDD